MAAQDPPHLAYDRETYLAVSTHLPPKDLSSDLPSPLDGTDDDVSPSSSLPASQTDTSSQSSSHSSLVGSLRYVGPVGQLVGSEHLYKLPLPTEQPTRPEVQEVKQWLEGKEGVQAVQVMVPKQRTKRMFEGE